MNTDVRAQNGPDVVLEVGKSFVIPVGTPLQIEIEGISAKLNSVAVGWLPENYLIMRQPASGFGSISSKLFKGNGITVRYITGGDAFAFRTEVLGSSDSPKLIFVAFPQRVVRHALRVNKRILCYLPAELFKETGTSELIPDTLYGIVSDISLSGCAFEMTKGGGETGLTDVRVEDPVKLRIQFPGREKMVEFSGHVRRAQRDGKRLNLGIRFHKGTGEPRDEIAEYVGSMEKFLL
jgi:hypothetical protein